MTPIKNAIFDLSGLTFSLFYISHFQAYLFACMEILANCDVPNCTIDFQSGKISQHIIFISRNYSRTFYTQLATEEKELILMGACAAAVWNLLPGTDQAVTTVPAFVHRRCWCCLNRDKPTIVASRKRNKHQIKPDLQWMERYLRHVGATTQCQNSTLTR